MIAIIDYGLGNVNAFKSIYEQLDVPIVFAKSKEDLRQATKIILPGVGAFDWAMSRLEASGMRSTLDKMVLDQKTPVLGVCVGMQIMAESSEEGEAKGLGWIPGKVQRLRDGVDQKSIRLPHMGWNDVIPLSTECLFSGIESPRYYFLHSYHLVPSHQEMVLAKFNYHGEHVCAVRSNNIFGTQFHPEKSHKCGVELLKKFWKI